MGNDPESRPVQLEYQSRRDLVQKVRDSLSAPVLLIAGVHFAISFWIVETSPRPEWTTWVLQLLMPQRWLAVRLMDRDTEAAARMALFLALLGPAVSLLYGVVLCRILKRVWSRQRE